MTVLAHGSVVGHAGAALAAVLAVVVVTLGELRRPEPSVRRLVAWTAGIVTLLAATNPWLEARADETFTAHMLQHLAIVIVAAPLLVAGEPFVAISRRLPRTAERTIRPWRRRLRRVPPVVPAAAFVGVLVLTHLTPVYDAALGSTWIHEAEHLGYLLTACALWASIRHASRVNSAPAVFAVLGVIAGTAIVSTALLSAPSPLVDTYADRAGDASALSDQRVAAATMWISGMLVTMPLLFLAVWRWADREQRIAERTEAIADRPRARASTDATVDTNATDDTDRAQMVRHGDRERATLARSATSDRISQTVPSTSTTARVSERSRGPHAG